MDNLNENARERKSSLQLLHEFNDYKMKFNAITPSNQPTARNLSVNLKSLVVSSNIKPCQPSNLKKYPIFPVTK